jgi:broad specificity phosphatase PhoE
LVRIILVRHGETDWNREHRLQGGASDIPLNDTGRRQAAELAARLHTVAIRAVYSSPLQRAVYTAEAIARDHQLKVGLLDGLKEIAFGSLEGFPSAQLPGRFDDYIAHGRHLEKDNTGCETLGDVQKRAWQAVALMAAGQTDGNLVVVSHCFVIASLVCRVLDMPLANLGRLHLSPGTLSIFTLDQDSATRLELFNGPG